MLLKIGHLIKTNLLYVLIIVFDVTLNRSFDQGKLLYVLIIVFDVTFNRSNDQNDVYDVLTIEYEVN